MKIIYKNKKALSETLLFEEGGVLHYRKTSLFEKKIHHVPIEHLGRDISFSRAYHAPFFLPPAFLSFLSIRLIIKKWSVGGWTLYFGLTVQALICLGLIYYFIVGKKTGEVEFYFGDIKLSLFMKERDFLEVKERFDNIKRMKHGE
jgi:hypothetical protein